MNKNISKSLIDGREYTIPLTDDSENIENFIRANKDKKIVAVQGLGFVGTVMSLVVANDDNNLYSVIGLDRNTPESYWKICDLNNGNMPISSSDPLVENFYQTTRKKNNFIATYDANAFSYADVIIVDINLDVDKVTDSNGNIKSYEVPLDGFKSAIYSIGKYCKPDVLILVETTVPPGTCREVVKPIIKEKLELRGLPSDKFYLGHSYERVMPGPNYVNSIKNFYRVYSGIDDRSADKVEKFLMTIISTDEYPLTRLKTTESTEMAKVLENSFRAMNISFMVEWSRFAEKSGVNLYEVVDAIRLRPTHANLMYPGIGVGGYCLTKDPLLASWASKEFFNLELGLISSVNAVEINDSMPRYCYNFVSEVFEGINKKINNIGFLGVAYGPGIGDTRFSPVEYFYKFFSNKYDIFCHDPYVSYWEEMKIKPEQSLSKFLSLNLDCLIITTGHKEYIESDDLYHKLEDYSKNNEIILIDTVGLLDPLKLPMHFILGKNYFVLGIGI